MTPEQFINIVRKVRFRRGWTFDATESWYNRSAVALEVMYTEPDSRPEYAPNYVKPVRTGTVVYIDPGDYPDELSIYRMLFKVLHEFLMEHEDREFFGIETNGVLYRPFHPHTPVGVSNWEATMDVPMPKDAMSSSVV